MAKRLVLRERSLTQLAEDNTAERNISSLTFDGYDAHVADLTTHFTEASIDHGAILNSGTTTHADLDTQYTDRLNGIVPSYFIGNANTWYNFAQDATGGSWTLCTVEYAGRGANGQDQIKGKFTWTSNAAHTFFRGDLDKISGTAANHPRLVVYQETGGAASQDFKYYIQTSAASSLEYNKRFLNDYTVPSGSSTGWAPRGTAATPNDITADWTIVYDSNDPATYPPDNEVYTHAATFIGPWAANQTGDIVLTKRGNLVWCKLPGFAAATNAAATISLNFGNELPARFCPAAPRDCCLIPVYDGAAYAIGTVIIHVSGMMTISSGMPPGNFNAGGGAGPGSGLFQVTFPYYLA